MASIGTIVSLISLSVGLSSGNASIAALRAIDIQPGAKNAISKATIIGLALIDTAAILALIITVLLFVKNPGQYNGIAHAGIVFAIGLPGFFVGLTSSYPLIETCYSIARQPFFSQKIINLMLITQSIIQTPLIFGFLISLLILNKTTELTSLAESITIFSSGIAFGIGSIGPTLGLGDFARHACRNISISRNAYNSLISFTFLSQAVIETPLIFALLISLLLTTQTSFNNEQHILLVSAKALGAALCIGLGTLSAGISSSKIASNACKQIAINPSLYRILSQTSLFGQGLIDATAVYALLISLFIVLLT